MTLLHARIAAVLLASTWADVSSAASAVIDAFKVDYVAESKLPDNAPAPARCPTLTLTKAGADALLDDMAKLYRFELRLSDGTYAPMPDAPIVFRPPAGPKPADTFNLQLTPRCPSLKTAKAADGNGFSVFQVAGREVGRFVGAANLVPDTTGMKNLSKIKAIHAFPFKFGEDIGSFNLTSAY